MKPLHITVLHMQVFSYSDNIGGSSSPWLVLEYFPNGDLKYFNGILIYSTVLFI